MSLKKNIFASYATQIYVTVVGILVLPLYLKYMGAEAYGLVAIFALLQVWFQLADMGLVSTMARQTALLDGGGATALSFRRLLRSLEGIFLCVAFLGAVVLILGADSVAAHWLKVTHLPTKQVINAIQLMALIAVLRWVGELYRGVISGFERMVWLGVFSSAVATVRFVLVIPFLIWAGSSPTQFFAYQLVVAAVETLVLWRKAYTLLPCVSGSFVGWSWQPLRGVLGFSTAMALASIVWVVVSQTDKLLLSSLLPLADYGRFSLAVLAAGGLLLLTGPIVTVLVPRLTALHGQGNDDAMLTLYRQATQWAGLLVWPACAVLACYAEQVLWVWTGNAELAAQAAPTLRLYALGNAAMALGAFPYYLQFARGQLRLHLVGTGLFVMLLLPCLWWAVARHGAVGAGWAWFAVNVAYLALWVPLAHAKQVRGLHGRWLLHDVAPIAVLAIAGVTSSQWLPWPAHRALVGLQLLGVSLLAFLAGAMGSSWLRTELHNRWCHRRLQRQA